MTDGQTDFSAADVLNELNAEQGIPIAYARNQNRMQNAIRILCDCALANTHIKNYTGYAKSVLWSSLNSYRVKMGVKYAVI